MVRLTEHAWTSYQQGQVIAALPGLIRGAQSLEEAGATESGGWRVSARIHHLAASTLAKVGEATWRGLPRSGR